MEFRPNEAHPSLRLTHWGFLNSANLVVSSRRWGTFYSFSLTPYGDIGGNGKTNLGEEQPLQSDSSLTLGMEYSCIEGLSQARNV